MSRNTGKRPHELTLELFAQNATQTPSEIDAYVKNGPYASKHIWFLRKLGYDISVNKQGRTVVSYTYNGVGTATPAAPKPAKVAKAPKRQVADPVAAKQNKLRPAAVKTAKTPEQIKADNLEKLKAVSAKITKIKQKAAAKKSKRRDPIDDVIEQFGNDGSVGSVSVDPGWDSIDGVDLKKII